MFDPSPALTGDQPVWPGKSKDRTSSGGGQYVPSIQQLIEITITMQHGPGSTIPPALDNDVETGRLRVEDARGTQRAGRIQYPKVFLEKTCMVGYKATVRMP